MNGGEGEFQTHGTLNVIWLSRPWQNIVLRTTKTLKDMRYENVHNLENELQGWLK